jgi:hypothetical protein
MAIKIKGPKKIYVPKIKKFSMKKLSNVSLKPLKNIGIRNRFGKFIKI